MSRSSPARWRWTWPSVEASLAGPKRPQDRVALGDVPAAFDASNELEVNHAQKPHKTVSYLDSETGDRDPA